MATYLTPNFTLEELSRSDVALRKGLDNTPTECMSNIMFSAEKMEQVRKVLGNQPIVVNSCYRSPEVNAAIGGSKTSAHMEGLAVDFVCPSYGTPFEVAVALKEGLPKGFFDQLIYEGTWVHIGFRWGDNRSQLMTARFVNGKAHYSWGIDSE